MRGLKVIVLSFLFASNVYGADLAGNIESILKNHWCMGRAKVSILVKSIGTGKIVYSKNPYKLMIPASNMKIVTSLAALDILDSTFIFNTPVSYTGERLGKVIAGDLVITGHGDPHLVTEDLFLMANEIRKRGIKRITGDLVLNDGYFDKERFPRGWTISKQRRAFEAPLGALSFNFNSFTISIYPPKNGSEKPVVSIDPETPYFKLVNNLKTVSSRRNSITIDYRTRPGRAETVIVGGTVRAGSNDKIFYRSVKYPISYFGLSFIEFLLKAGIILDGKVVHTTSAPPSHELFVHSSKPMYEQLAYMNKFSNNFMAEQILKTIAAETVSPPGTEANGIKKIKEFLVLRGFPQEGYRIYDGSGFSKKNRLTTSLIVSLLENAYYEWKGGPEFLTSLALMGRDGSVEDRFTSIKKTVRVKTGTLKSVSALSGYYPLDSGDILVFSMIFNDLPCENGEALHIQNRLLREFEKIDVREK